MQKFKHAKLSQEWCRVDNTLRHASGLLFSFDVRSNDAPIPINPGEWADMLRAQGIEDRAINPAFNRLASEASAQAEFHRKRFSSSQEWKKKPPVNPKGNKGD
jgi:hypothetical protein